jgi:hypothetical protein
MGRRKEDTNYYLSALTLLLLAAARVAAKLSLRHCICNVESVEMQQLLMMLLWRCRCGAAADVAAAMLILPERRMDGRRGSTYYSSLCCTSIRFMSICTHIDSRYYVILYHDDFVC